MKENVSSLYDNEWHKTCTQKEEWHNGPRIRVQTSFTGHYHIDSSAGLAMRGTSICDAACGVVQMATSLTNARPQPLSLRNFLVPGRW